MRFSAVLAFSLAAAPIVSALAGTPPTDASSELVDRRSDESSVPHPFIGVENASRKIVRRKGGGGKSSSSGSGRSSSSSKKSSTSKSSSKSKTPKGAASPKSNAGGRTTTGTGPSRSYGGYYAGGAVAPFAAGRTSPSGIVPYLAAGAVGAGIATLAFGTLTLAGLAYYPWIYSWPQNYNFYNATTALNESLPVKCLCQQYLVCGCDYNNDTAYMDSLLSTGRYENLNHSVIDVFDYQGNRSIFMDGTLPNGTTAPGGSVDPNAAVGGSPLPGLWALGLFFGALAYVV